MSTRHQAIHSIFFFCLFTLGIQAWTAEENTVNFSADFYGSHVNLMPYKGSQQDLSATLYAQYADYPVLILARYVHTNFYYLNEAGGNISYTADRRIAAGLGLDIKVNSHLKIRFISEQINSKLANLMVNRVSYGLIYNQYSDLGIFELNNYLEAFYIPSLSEKVDTFFRVQGLKSFYLTQAEYSSNTIYPFAQVKTKYNDDSIFGISGHNISLGGGYKYIFQKEDSGFSFLLEAHGVSYQSRDLNGDWAQALVAMQWLIN